MSNVQACPICAQPTTYSRRYPNHICSECIDSAVDASGRAVKVCNAKALGYGVKVVVSATDEDLGEVNVFIQGHECVPREAYFGGIVIQPLQK